MGIKANLPAKMTEDVRGGTRGGHDQFSWDSVKTDTSRAHYIGNSVKAPMNLRSEGTRDPFWYERGVNTITGQPVTLNSKMTSPKSELEQLKVSEEQLRREMLAVEQAKAAEAALRKSQIISTNTSSTKPESQSYIRDDSDDYSYFGRRKQRQQQGDRSRHHNLQSSTRDYRQRLNSRHSPADNSEASNQQPPSQRPPSNELFRKRTFQ